MGTVLEFSVNFVIIFIFKKLSQPAQFVRCSVVKEQPHLPDAGALRWGLTCWKSRREESQPQSLGPGWQKDSQGPAGPSMWPPHFKEMEGENWES